MTAHLIALLVCWIMPAITPTPAPPKPKEPTDAQILREGQRRANQFCTPDYIYPEGAVPFIVPCGQPVPDCSESVFSTNKYLARCHVTL